MKLINRVKNAIKGFEGPMNIETKKSIFTEAPESVFGWQLLPDATILNKVHAYCNWIVYRCINLISDSVSTLPYELFDKANNQVFDHPVLSIINDKANDYQSGKKYLKSLVSYYWLEGNCYGNLVAGTPEAPAEMWSLMAQHVEVKKGGPENPIKEYVYRSPEFGGTAKRIEPEDIMHISTWNIDDQFVGMSPIDTITIPIKTQDKGEQWNLRLISNGAKPSGMIVPKNRPFSDAEFKKLKREVKKKWQGVENVGELLLAPYDVDVKILDLKPTDIDWSNMEKVTVRKVGNVIAGTPAEMLGDGENKTYSNQKEARQGYYMESVIPMGEIIASSMNHYHFPDGSYHFKINKHEIAAIQVAMTDKTNALNTAWWMTGNEKRESMGKDKMSNTNMDQILVPGTFTPLDDLVLGDEGDEGSDV